MPPPRTPLLHCPVTGKTVTLTVTGPDDGGEPALRYTWSKLTGPGDVASWVTFTQPGDDVFRVTVEDAGGQTATSELEVSVMSTPKVTVTPAEVVAPPPVAPGGGARFSAAAALVLAALGRRRREPRAQY